MNIWTLEILAYNNIAYAYYIPIIIYYTSFKKLFNNQEFRNIFKENR